MADHTVRRAPTPTAPQQHERVSTTEIPKQLLHGLVRAHAEPDPLEVTVVATTGPYEPTGANAARLASGSAPRLAHTLRRSQREGAPLDRRDVATIAMPRVERPAGAIPRLFDDHHDERPPGAIPRLFEDHHDEPTVTLHTLPAELLLARAASDSSSTLSASAVHERAKVLTIVDELATRRAEARRSQQRAAEPNPSDAMRAQPQPEGTPSASALHAPQGSNVQIDLIDLNPSLAPEPPGAIVRSPGPPKRPVFRRGARWHLALPVGLLLLLAGAAAVLVRAIF
jgi:hypothetical protein